jgi:hypothetical protein
MSLMSHLPPHGLELRPGRILALLRRMKSVLGLVRNASVTADSLMRELVQAL